MTLIDLIPNPVTVTKTIIGTALQTVDYGLKTSAVYAEKADHLVRPVSHKTELNHGDEADGNYHAPVAIFIEAIREQIQRGSPVTMPIEGVAGVIDALAVSKITGGEDDRLFLLENALTFLSRYPEKSLLQPVLQDKVISLLYNDLAHPPASVVGRKYRYRSADGSGTSLWNPDMGKAGTSYARSVQGLHPLPPSELPSPELLFDTLLKREKQEDHPAGLSSLFFAFANLVIHQLFYTNHFADQSDPQNMTSSYLDLSIVYGNNQRQQDTIRPKDGTGKIYPDSFADGRLLGMPPSTPALCVLFSRNHNFICEKLLEINERKQWCDPPKPETKDQQDEDIFQTARLVNCGFFMQTILSDYLGAILGTVRKGNSWALNPLEDYRNSDHSVSQRGEGNLVSVEFNALYHFHASISAMDEKWAEESFRRYLGDTPWDEVTPQLYMDAVVKMKEEAGSDPRVWPIGTVTRNSAGKFDDQDLARLLQDATAYPASAFKARGTPHALRIIEIMGIQQNRDWGTCSLNEFRKFLGLRPYRTFEEWNPRADVAGAARRLYGHPDNIELYVGLQAEEAKPVRDGTGLCGGFTITRAILSDAVALVRGDRFLTSDFTAYNLTAWGLKDAQRNPNNSANGGTLAKLLMRTLPDFYPDDSVYTEFPLMTPSAMKTNLTKLGTAHKYKFDRPARRKPIQPIRSYVDAQAILANDYFKTEYVENAGQVLPPHGGYLLTLNDMANNNSDRRLITDNFATASSVKKQMDYLGSKTLDLIKTKSYTLVGGKKRSVNIVRDVLNLIPVHFVSDHVIGLPLKTETHQFGTFYEKELYEKLKDVYNYVFLDNDPTTHISRQSDVKGIVDNFVRLTGHHFSSVRGFRIPGVGLVDAALHFFLNQSTLSHDWIRRLRANSTKSDHELINDVISLAIVVSVEFSQVLTHIVDTFLPASIQPDLDDAARALNAQMVALGKEMAAAYAGAAGGSTGSSTDKTASDTTQQASGLSSSSGTANGSGALPAKIGKGKTGSSSAAAKGATATSPSVKVPLSAERQKEIDAINARSDEFIKLARSCDPSAAAQLKGYIAEALRLAPAVPGVYRDAATDVSVGKTLYKRGDRLFISIVEAQSDVTNGAKFSAPIADPKAMTTSAVPASLLGDGLLRLLGQEWVINMAVPVVQTIFSLRGVGRAGGCSGELGSFVLEVPRTSQVDPATGGEVPGTGCKVRSYLDKNYQPTPWSSSLTITYDE